MTLVLIGVTLAASAGLAAAAEREDRVKPCEPVEVKRAVHRFVAAFNAGDLAQLDRMLAPKPYFRFYATDGPGRRILPSAAKRATLSRYFARRHELGERMTIRWLRVNGNTLASGRYWKTYGNFEFRLVREAHELQPTSYQGKGSLHCYASQPDQIVAWSMGREA